MRSRLLLVAALLLASSSCASSSWDPVAGTEDRTLAEKLTGALLVRESPRAERDLEVHALSGGEPKRLKLELEADAFSGPDAEGRFVYDCVHLPNLAAEARSTHEVRLARLDGKPERLLLAESGVLQGRNALALSSQGGHVACAVAHRGCIALSIRRLDEEARQICPIKSRCVNDLQWLEDGKTLVYAGTFAWEDAPLGLRPEDPPARFGKRDDIDLVAVYDVARRTETPIAAGTRALAIPGRNAVAVVGSDGVVVVDAVTGRRLRDPRPIPGALPVGPSAFAALDLDRILYVGRPTKGAEPRYYLGDQLVRYRMVTIKVADLASGAFATVVPYVKTPLASYGR